ncbi:DUF4331 domain-containing protein [Engelhardtia mirabilis]|uniref:DUF4331 domain-containing protein n=1 Tax=Engelhardtia mirabilis TaxID=2528011 RepID=A0A518BDS9_9BACT|nr:hypothetical protein Pla133_01760 [Planctomycetes bacterium Pla133]QDU99438.1 hypothetical protein Pla86_01760 [Planctomycetes bacterium Pla86]
MNQRLLLGGAVGAGALAFALSHASNHREAPITALDHKADITDLFAFVSYDQDQAPGEAPEFVTLILGVDPLLEPANGPTLFPFDPDILYAIHVDNDHDALPDKRFEFRFDTTYQLPDVYTAVAGIGPNGASDPQTGNLVVPPRIDDFQDLGLNQRQTYTLDLVDVASGVSTPLMRADGAPLYALPGNPGPRTMDYEALFDQAINPLQRGIQAFAGTVDDPFFIDLGAAFDTANFRTLGSGVPGVLTAQEDGAKRNFASDTVSGYAVNVLALEVPIALLTATGQIEPADSPFATLGVYGSTSRPQMTVLQSPDPAVSSGPFRQVQRIGNPLINELVIGIGSKDKFSMSEPAGDAQFEKFLLDPPIVGIVEALYGGALAVPDAPRFDLLPLVTYAAPIAAPGTPTGPTADLLRINTGVPATPLGSASRLGLIGGDAAGFPNGRRLYDDVVDITLRVAVGGVLDPSFAGFDPDVNGRLGDGVNVNDARLRADFPYLASAPSGRDRRHVDPGEPGGGPID